MPQENWRKSIERLLDDSLTSICLRIGLYILILIGLAYLIVWDASFARTNNLFSENSLTELCQEGILVFIIVSLLRIASTDRFHKSLSLILADLFMCALLREFDSLLDNYVFDGAWQIGVSILLFFVVITWAQHRTDTNAAVYELVSQPSFGILLSGLLTVLVFSRLFGQQVLWMQIMESGFQRSVKNAAEEGVELFGYYLCLLGVLEYGMNRYIHKTEILHV